MDAKTTHVVLLAAWSLVCTALAWAVDHAVFSSVFAALAAVAVLGITPREQIEDVGTNWFTTRRESNHRFARVDRTALSRPARLREGR
jgi:hypothetical protein